MTEPTKKELLAEESRARRRIVGKWMLPAVLGVFAVTVPLFLMTFESTVLSKGFFVLTLAVSGVSVFALLIYYLQSGFPKSSGAAQRILGSAVRFSELEALSRGMRAEQIADIDHLRSELKEIQRSLLTSTAALTDEQRKEFVQALRDEMESEAVDGVLNKIKQEVSTFVKRDSQLAGVSAQFSRTFERLDNEVSALARRGNLNLVLGIMTTVAGLSVLAYVVFAAEGLSKDPWLVSAYYLPRLSLVVFIEVFAYFFLRLYKSSLIDIKYFQNEITNVEAKYIATQLASGSTDEKIQGEVIDTLAKTERNFVLQRGQTTVDLEKERIERQTARDSVKVVSEALKNVLSKSS